jgi:predicted O-methyltransferase YrrM
MKDIKEPLSNRKRADLYYELLAGGAKTKLLESIINFNLPELLSSKGEILESDLTKELELHPLRAKKWYFLLTREGFLRRKKTDLGYVYCLGPVTKQLMGKNNDQWWFFKQMTYSWQTIAYESLYSILRGATVNSDIHWPPKNDIESIAIEEWMTRTSVAPISTIESAINLNKVKHLLDIGGGEGTMACDFAKKYPHLKVTLYNLPVAIKLARKNIKLAGLDDRVKMVEGDFFKDRTFPAGCDLILFSRVLCDWSSETAERLLKMAYEALSPGGQVAICEAFQENNKDFSTAWEFRYLFWDEFETEVFKSSLTYKKILTDIGYKLTSLSKLTDDSTYTVLTAQKKKQIPIIQNIIRKWIGWKYERMQEIGY